MGNEQASTVTIQRTLKLVNIVQGINKDKVML